MLTLDGEVRGDVTALEPRPPTPGSLDNTHIAVGYSDGSLAVFDLMLGHPLKFTGMLYTVHHHIFIMQVIT